MPLHYSSDLAVEDTGTMLVLSSLTTESSGYSLTRCSKLGEPIEKVSITGTPSEFDDFTPDSLMCANNQIYLVDRKGMKAIIADPDGEFQAGYFITADGPEELCSSSIDSFRVDDMGILSFTLSCGSEPVVVTVGGDNRPTSSCSCNGDTKCLTLGVITFIGLFVSCYLIQ